MKTQSLIKNNEGKGENVGYQHFRLSPLPKMFFLPPPPHNFPPPPIFFFSLLATLYLSSENPFDLEKYLKKKMSYGEEFT